MLTKSEWLIWMRNIYNNVLARAGNEGLPEWLMKDFRGTWNLIRLVLRDPYSFSNATTAQLDRVQLLGYKLGVPC